MFKFTRVQDYEFQITDFPKRIAYIPLFIAVLALPLVFLTSHGYIGTLTIILMMALVVCLLKKNETNINFNTKAIYYSQRNVFKKKYATIDLKEASIELDEDRKSKMYAVYLKEGDRKYKIISSDLYNNDAVLETYKKVKHLLD